MASSKPSPSRVQGLVLSLIMNKSFPCKFVRRRLFSCCPLPLEPQKPSLSSLASHADMCFLLADDLLRRGLFSSAQKVIQRFISKSPSIPEANAVIDFACSRGMRLDSASYGCLIRKLVNFSEVRMAEALYMNCIVGGGLEPDRDLLNSMIICYCKLSKLDEAKSCYDRVMELGTRPWVGSINAIIKGFLEQDRIWEAYDCFSGTSEASNVALEFSCYNRLVNGFCQRGLLDEGLDVFDVMLERGISPTIHVCKSLIIGLCKWGRAVEAEILCTEIESYGFVVDEFMYTYLINSYCKARKMKMAMRLFMRILKMGYEPDKYTYNTLIHGFFNLGLFAKGWVLHDKMISSGLEPDVVTYQTILNNYCREGKVDRALKLLDDMSWHGIAPNVHCYTVLIAALCKERRSKEIYRLYLEMLDGGVVPDHVFFFTLAKNLPEEELNIAHAILQDIAKESYNISLRPQSPAGPVDKIEHLLEVIAKSNSSLADTALNIYLIALCMRGKLDTALCCLKKMTSLKLLPSVTAFNSLIKLLVQEGQAQDVQSLLEFMQDHGLVPNQLTFSVIVDELCKQDDFESALSVVDQIKERGIKPNVAIYDSIIKCLGKHRMVHEAENLFYRMLESGIDPDETIFVTMINMYAKNGWAKDAYMLFEKMLEYNLTPNSHAYTALIPGLFKRNMTQKGFLYLKKMRADGFLPNTVLYTSLIKQFLRKRDVIFAYRLVSLMETSAVEKDLITYITWFSGVSRNLDGMWYLPNKMSAMSKDRLLCLLHRMSVIPERENVKYSVPSQKEMKRFALTLIQGIEAKRIALDLIEDIQTVLSKMPNLYLYNGMMSMLCCAGSMREANEQLNLMKEAGVQPNQVTYIILINWHLHRGEVDLAIALFNKMNGDGVPPDRILFNSLIRGFCIVRRVREAMSLLLMMQKRGFVPSKKFLRETSQFISFDVFVLSCSEVMQRYDCPQMFS